MEETYRTRGVENNLNEVLTILATHVVQTEPDTHIEIGIWDIDVLPVTYYAVVANKNGYHLVGESSYGASSLAEAVAELIKDLHEYIDSLEDIEDD